MFPTSLSGRGYLALHFPRRIKQTKGARSSEVRDGSFVPGSFDQFSVYSGSHTIHSPYSLNVTPPSLALFITWLIAKSKVAG